MTAGPLHSRGNSRIVLELLNTVKLLATENGSTDGLMMYVVLID